MADNMREHGIVSEVTASQIRAERAASGLSQTEMVERSGISRSTYIRLEKGTRVSDVEQLRRICNALNISMTTFMERVTQRLAAIERGEDGVH